MIEKKLFYEIKKNADFHSVVMTSFSFDFHHFETQVLKQIKQKGITNVCLFVDEKMLDESIGFFTGNLKSLSSSYSVNGIASKGVFHPKLALFVGEREIMLLQGSGNITSGGHGKNHELFSVLYATEEDTTQLPLLIEAWHYLKNSTSNVKGFSQEKLNWIQNNAPLLTKTKSIKHNFHSIRPDVEVALLYNEKTGIFNQLVDLVPNKDISKIRILSPFYDENGALLLSLSQNYTNCEMEVYLQDKKGIHPHKMEKQKNIHFYSWDITERASKNFKKYERKLHAKLFIFESKECNYCLIGSPNASLAAFGQDNYSGANDEFAVLYKYKSDEFIKELGIFGTKQKLTLSTPIEVEEKKALEKEKNNAKKIKILGADKEGKTVLLFLQNYESITETVVRFYDSWGTMLEEQTNIKLSEKVKIELSPATPINSVAYLQFFNKKEQPISAKHLLNNVSDLWNTNPSAENRKLMRLTSMIESGEYKLFEVMEYFNTLHSNKSTTTNNSSTPSGNSNNEEKSSKEIDDVLTYEEAISIETNSKAHQLILKQHHSVKIWDSFEKYLKEYARAFEEDNMDDEEEADASSSRDRKEINYDKKQEYFSSVNILEKRRLIIYKFFNNYLKALDKIELIENKKLGLVDLAMLLIVMQQLFEVTHRKFTIKNQSHKEGSTDYIYEIQGDLSDIGCFSGAILNALGQFITIATKASWEEPKEEYAIKKLNHYKNICGIKALFSIAIMKLNYKNESRFHDWFDVTAINILSVFGKPNDEFENNVESLINESHIENISYLAINKLIKDWIKVYDSGQLPQNYFTTKFTGTCIVRKNIPLENPKFLKLSRPGFEYNEKEHDFIAKKLFDLNTSNWFDPNPRRVNDLYDQETRE
nr:hypothetical protein [uncultured Flavobacterium sp.]